MAGALRNGINTLLKETLRTPLPFDLVRTQGEACDPEESPSLFTIMSSAEILKKYACLFSCFIIVTRSPSLTLSKSVYSGHPCLVPDFLEECVIFNVKDMTLPRFFVLSFINLKNFLSCSCLLRDLP